LGDALDSEICRYSELQGRIIISKDEDFLYFAKRGENPNHLGPPGQLPNVSTLGSIRAVLAQDRILSEGWRPNY